MFLLSPVYRGTNLSEKLSRIVASFLSRTDSDGMISAKDDQIRIQDG